jgi:hypothetical protein
VDNCPDECFTRSEGQGAYHRFHNMLGMSKHVFRRLASELTEYGGLRRTKHITIVEQLAIFLHMACEGKSNRSMQERFQRSADTISKYTASIQLNINTDTVGSISSVESFIVC